MQLNPHLIWRDVQAIRSTQPLIHNITNFVVMNTTANALLAIGASPAMVHSIEEVEEFVSISHALVVNIGTLDTNFVEGMKLATRQAHKLNKPIVFDPVGVGATSYRNKVSTQLIQDIPPSVIRGNASEIMALAGLDAQTKGVDSVYGSEAALNAAYFLSKKYNSTVVISGATDFIIHQDKTVSITNGHHLLSKVTGMGCTATALIGAFVSINPNYFEAAAHAMAVMGISGEIAAEKNPYPGSLQVNFLDTLYKLTGDDILYRLQVTS